jgi:hypothetical protein
MSWVPGRARLFWFQGGSRNRRRTNSLRTWKTSVREVHAALVIKVVTD